MHGTRWPAVWNFCNHNHDVMRCRLVGHWMKWWWNRRWRVFNLGIQSTAFSSLFSHCDCDISWKRNALAKLLQMFSFRPICLSVNTESRGERVKGHVLCFASLLSFYPQKAVVRVRWRKKHLWHCDMFFWPVSMQSLNNTILRFEDFPTPWSM